MGAIAEGFAEFARPLLDQTDGSPEQLNKALAIAQLCYNLALLPEERRDKMLDEVRRDLAMDDEEFAAFRRDVVDRMIRRHEEMFPRMHGRASIAEFPGGYGPRPHPGSPTHGEQPVVVDRYAPCPCNSGKKYKFCCGLKRR